MKRLRRRLYLWLQEKRGRSKEIFSPHGIPVRIPNDSDLAIRYLLAKGRSYEEQEARFVRRYLKKGTNVIELGGCMGIVSALIRDQIGPDAHHIVVEADSNLAEICGHNALQNANDGNTDIVVAAVDYSGAETVTFARGQNAHVGHLARPGEDGIVVPTTTVTELAEKLPAGRFALVCDIEGAKIDLFEAEIELLSRISLIVLETHPANYPNGVADLEKLGSKIQAAGFDLVDEDADVFCYARPGDK